MVVLVGCLALAGAYLATAGGDDTASPGGDPDVSEPETGTDDGERLPQSPPATPVDLDSPTPGERLDPPAGDAEAGGGEGAGAGGPVEPRGSAGADGDAEASDGGSGGPDAGTVGTTTPTTDATGGPTTSTPGDPSTTSPTTAPPADGGSVLGDVLDLLHVLV